MDNNNEILTSRLESLQKSYGELDAKELLDVMVNSEFKNEIAFVSSFGSGSALLLSLIAEIDPNAPILFLETGKHFPETLDYVESLSNHLDLKNVQMLKPREDLVNNIDSSGDLWESQPNRCCWLRKVEPLQRALDEGGYKALITGRKRYQTPQRANMENIELNEDERFRINPLAYWSKEKVESEFKNRNLPEHPLVKDGYLSIGCAPCTRPVKEGEDPRAGRWAHTADADNGGQKVECGIHIEGKSDEQGGVQPKPQKPELNI